MAQKRRVRYGLNAVSEVAWTCCVTQSLKAVDVNTKIMTLMHATVNSRLRWTYNKRHVHVCSRPCKNNVCPTIAIVVSLFGCSISVFFLCRWLHSQGRTGCGPKLIDIFTSSRQLDFQNIFAIDILDLLCATEILGSAIVTFGTPDPKLMYSTDRSRLAPTM